VLIESLRCTTMAYELYYAFATTPTAVELACFMIWFAMDLTFVTVAIVCTVPPKRRAIVVFRMAIGVLVGLGVFHWLCKTWPDEREQVTAYGTGIFLQFPISLGELVVLLKRGDTKGQSLEIW
jgi:hypothetical protein